MTALIVITWTIIGMVAGIVVGGAIAPAFGYRDMEGMSGIFAVFFIAPVGALAGGMLGFAVARKYADKRQKIVGFSLLGIALAVLGGFVFEQVTNDMLDRRATLVFEIRLPPGMPVPEWSSVSGHLRSKGQDGSRISSYGSTGRGRDGDTIVLQGHVDVYRQTTDRVVTFRIGNGPAQLFRINAPAKPLETKNLGPWSKADFIEDGTAKRTPNQGEAFEIRYRMYY